MHQIATFGTMRIKVLLPFLVLLCLVLAFRPGSDPRIASVVIDPKVTPITMYNLDDSGHAIGNIGKLKAFVESKSQHLRFAMNSGMYMEDLRPLGLYIENGRTIRKLITKTKGYGNFYLQPNGVFGIDGHGEAFIVTTGAYGDRAGVRYATQSGPMLVVDGAINDAFTKGSANVQIRNGVGILPDGKTLFAITRTPMNLYDFSLVFQQHGCANALFLDGAISRTYMPSEGVEQMNGALGVLIAVVE
jgi:uncharacterized protein YigE (DUF2233 family)